MKNRPNIWRYGCELHVKSLWWNMHTLCVSVCVLVIVLFIGNFPKDNVWYVVLGNRFPAND